MELNNKSFQYGKVALAVRTQYHQLQFMFKVVAICTDTCMSLVQTVRSLLLRTGESEHVVYMYARYNACSIAKSMFPRT